MKKIAIYYFSLAAIVGGSLASCQEDDLGYTSEEIALHKIQKDYERDFIKEFGEPAPGHQWGFDLADQSFSALSQTRTYYKQEDNVDDTYTGQAPYYWDKVYDYFTVPANITEHEHEDVLAWFTNHKVEWTKTPTISTDPNSRNTTDGIAHLQNNWDYKTTTHLIDAPIEPSIITNFESNFAWIQTVAWSETKDEYQYNSSTNKYDVLSDYSGANMDFLMFTTVENINNWTHLRDFNAQNRGYGYNRQPPMSEAANQNASLVTNCNFNNFQYRSSGDDASDVQFHNKWFMVYLKGDDYEGWYLGIDFEAYGTNDNNKVKADGICNDWIIKLGEVLPKPTKVETWRIMCEDLGSSFDKDFNDIVYDVAWNGEAVFITLQAAGGTLPIKFKYKDQVLTNKGKDEIHAMFGYASTTPINVRASGGADNQTPVSWTFTCSTKPNIQNDFTVLVGVSEATELDIAKLDSDTKLPYRFCVPNTVRWCQENKPTPKAYAGFRDWVSDNNNKFWEAGKVIDESLLY